jgi:hypothetical protein
MDDRQTTMESDRVVLSNPIDFFKELNRNLEHRDSERLYDKNNLAYWGNIKQNIKLLVEKGTEDALMQAMIEIIHSGAFYKAQHNTVTNNETKLIAKVRSLEHDLRKKETELKIIEEELYKADNKIDELEDLLNVQDYT